MEFLLTIGIGVNIFTFFQLLQGKNAGLLPNKIGMLIIGVWTMRFWLLYLKITEFSLDYPWLLILDQHLFFLDSVLLWLYARSLLHKPTFSLRLLWHFLPFFLGVLSALWMALSNSPASIVANYQNTVKALRAGQLSVSIDAFIFVVIILVMAFVYFYKSIQALRNYNQLLLANFSNLRNLKVAWVINFHRLWIALFIIPVLVYFGNYLYIVLDAQFLTWGLICSLVSLSFFFNSSILNQYYIQKDTFKNHRSEKKQISSQVSPEQVQVLKDKLATEKYYEDETLSLDKLASHLGLKPIELTELIKLSPYDNFYDLVNTYRVEAVKTELLHTSEQIMIIAYNNGFNSKSTFNKIFKDKTGLTPSQYRKSAQ